MTYAYSEMYLEDAMRTLGEAVDFALCDQGLSPVELTTILSDSLEMKQFERGAPRVVCGMSGDELAREIIAQLYEQNQLDLRRASVSSALALANTLGCTIEDLIWQPIALEFDSQAFPSVKL